jgi:hypothetical protein
MITKALAPDDGALGIGMEAAEGAAWRMLVVARRRTEKTI